jgi:hypothetical protein
VQPTNANPNTQNPVQELPMTYEERNPTVAGRVPLALFQRLQAQMKATGQSMGKILRTALDPALRDRQADYDKGYADGYEDGKSDFVVTYPCRKCGRLLPVVSEAARAEVAELMPARGWECKECPPSGSSQALR